MSKRTAAQTADWLTARAHEGPGGCLLCHLKAGMRGYCLVMADGKVRAAHRVVYERHHGPIPAGLLVRHRCDVKTCIQPGHLLVGTPADNMRDKVERGRSMYGERNSHAKLTADLARAITRATRFGRDPERARRRIQHQPTRRE